MTLLPKNTGLTGLYTGCLRPKFVSRWSQCRGGKKGDHGQFASNLKHPAGVFCLRPASHRGRLCSSSARALVFGISRSHQVKPSLPAALGSAVDENRLKTSHAATRYRKPRSTSTCFSHSWSYDSFRLPGFPAKRATWIARQHVRQVRQCRV